MALRIGWAKIEKHESTWVEDPAYGSIPDDVVNAFLKDLNPDALAPFIKPGEAPTVITWRNLIAPEQAYCEDAKKADGELGEESFLRAFTIGCRFPGIDKITEDSGAVHDGTVRVIDRHLQLMEGFVTELLRNYQEIAVIFGRHILKASRLTDAEKKASSPPSTPTPSSGASQTPTGSDSSKVGTAASAEPGAAAA